MYKATLDISKTAKMEFKTLVLNLLILFCLINKINGADQVPQIKVVGTQLTYINPTYQNDVVYTVKKLNETFNYLTAFWDLKEDPPADTAVYLKVFVTDSTYQGGKLVLETVTPMCQPSEYRELLPSMLQVPESMLNTQCLKKGTYQADNLVQFRFEVLVPNIETLGSYYRAEYRFGNEETTVGAVNFYSEWGYLNPN